MMVPTSTAVVNFTTVALPVSRSTSTSGMNTSYM